MVNDEGALFVYQKQAPPPQVGTENKVRLLNGLLGTSGLDAGVVNLKLDGSVTPLEAYVVAHADYDIHVMGISFILADSAVTHNRFGNITELSTGINLFAEEAGEITYALKNVKTGGQLIAQSGGARSFGTGGESHEIVNWSGTGDAQLVFLDMGSMLPPEGLRIGRGTQDRLVLQINDDLTGLDEFSARIMGFKKYP